MLAILADILAIPTLVFLSNVGNISPVYKVVSHIEAVPKNRPINAKATPAFSLAKTEDNVNLHHIFIISSTVNSKDQKWCSLQ